MDLELTPYEVFKEKGADKLIEIIEKGNFYELGKSIPEKGEDKLIAEFYEKLKNGDIDYIDKNYNLNCEKELKQKMQEMLREDVIGIDKQKCYHMTKYLKEIICDDKPGLKPLVGNNSKHVNDIKKENKGVSYSIGLEGIIVTNAMFRARYQYDLLEHKKDGDVTLDDMFNQDVKKQENMALWKYNYLTFDETEKMREENKVRDIAYLKTKSSIDIKDIRGVILTNSKTGEVKYDRESIIRYAISKTNLEDILSKIQKCNKPFMNMEGYAKTEFSFMQYVKRYYEEMIKDPEMIEFKNGEYELQEIETNELLEMVEHDNTIEMKQAEMKDYENAMGSAEGKSGFDDSMEAETKASDVQKATHDIRKINEQQKEITNEDRWR